MKKIIVFLLMSLFILSLFISCTGDDFDELDEQDIVYIDFGFFEDGTGKGLTSQEYLSVTGNPFLEMYSETVTSATGLNEFEKQFICFNMAAVAEQSLPMIPALSTVKGNVKSFVAQLNNNKNKNHMYGFTVKLDQAVAGNDGGFFARYYFYVSDEAEDPFYQIDYYYKDGKFSYRGLMMINMRADHMGNDNIRYFQLNNVEVENNSYTAGTANNFRADVFEFAGNGIHKGNEKSPIDSFVITTWNIFTKFSNELVATTGMNPKVLKTSGTDNLFIPLSSNTDICNALAAVYQDKESTNIYSTVTNTIDFNGTLEDGKRVGLDSDLWTIDVTKIFMKSYYSWEGSEFPLEKIYYSMEDFNKGNLVLDTADFTESKGIYYPCIYSIKKGIGAILNPKDYVALDDSDSASDVDFQPNGYNSPINCIYRQNFYKYFGYLGFTEPDGKNDFEEFVTTLLKVVGVTENP